MTTIKTYTGQKATFYIQSKGNNAGRPLRDPKPNSFAVITDVENSFEIVFALWKSRKFDLYIKGSVIPFIKITDIKKIVFINFSRSSEIDKKRLKAVKSTEDLIKNLKEQIKKTEQLQELLARQAVCEK